MVPTPKPKCSAPRPNHYQHPEIQDDPRYRPKIALGYTTIAFQSSRRGSAHNCDKIKQRPFATSKEGDAEASAQIHAIYAQRRSAKGPISKAIADTAETENKRAKRTRNAHETQNRTKRTNTHTKRNKRTKTHKKRTRNTNATNAHETRKNQKTQYDRPNSPF